MAETPHDPGVAPARRELELDGVAWIAEITGRCMVGGRLAAAALESIHFGPGDEAAGAVRLAYLPAGAFARLHDDELIALLRAALPLAARPAFDGDAGSGPGPDGTVGASGTVTEYPGGDG